MTSTARKVGTASRCLTKDKGLSPLNLTLPATRIAGVGKWPISPGGERIRTWIILDHRGEVCSGQCVHTGFITLVLMAARGTDRLPARGPMATRTDGGNPGQRFRGKGGSRDRRVAGIGRAVSLRLARRGPGWGSTFVSNAPAAAETVEQVHRLGTEAEAVQADVSDRSAVQAMVDRILERFSPKSTSWSTTRPSCLTVT